MKSMRGKGAKIAVYEPTLNEDYFFENRVIHDLKEFKGMTDVIVANRYDSCLDNVLDKVYTRDLFRRDWSRKRSVKNKKEGDPSWSPQFVDIQSLLCDEILMKIFFAQ